MGVNFISTQVKYTAMLSQDSIKELKALAEKKIIPSVSHGIRFAVEDFVALQKRREYAELMCEAAKDNEFIKRTIDMQEDFAAIDYAGDEKW